MKGTCYVVLLIQILCCAMVRAQNVHLAREVSGIPHCSPGAFLILEEGLLAGVDWVEYHDSQVHSRTILMQSRVIDATIDLRVDGTASHSSVVLANAGEEPGKPIVRDLGDGAIYLSDMIVSSVEQAVVRARVLNQAVSHVAATSLYRDSPTDVIVQQIDAEDWTVSFRSKTYQVLTDDHGCMLAAALPEYGLVIERHSEFSPTKYPLWPPYAAPPDGAYQASEVKIPAPQGHVLTGTLTQPRANEPVPSAVLITGLGPAERNGGTPRGCRCAILPMR